MSAEASPDSRCPICFDTYNNIAYVDLCMHKFCFLCIIEWSKSKAQCPLCKQTINSIYHSIKSEQDYLKTNLIITTVAGPHGQMRLQTSPGPYYGIMFEISPSSPQQRQDGFIRSMMMRLATSREAAREGKSVNNITEQEMVNFRMEVYRRGLRVRYVCNGNLFQIITANFYKRFPARLCKLMPWLKREITALCGSYLWEEMQYVIIRSITTNDMESEATVNVLRPLLRAHTEHFLHEFISFAKSPFNMEDYDQHAVYDCPDPYSSTAEESSTEHPSVLDCEETRENEGSAQQASPNSQTDETQDERPPEESVFSESDDDCVIVGFIEPAAERTPELVLLSSDSESATEDVPQGSIAMISTNLREASNIEKGTQTKVLVEGQRRRKRR